MAELIESNWKKRQLQKLMHENLNAKDKVFLKNLLYCGSKIDRTGHGALLVRRVDAVESAKFVGLTHCGNAWLCPCCAVAAARKTGKWLAGAIEATKVQNLKAFMATFTIGHCRRAPLENLLDSLYDVRTAIFRIWKLKKSGGYSLIKQWAEACGVKHFFWACEVTWSYKYGWHPHLHALIFCEADKFQNNLEWEKRLNKLWQDTALETLKRSLSGYPETQAEIERVYAGKLDRTVGIYFSKDAKNNLRVEESSSYVTGWTVQESTAQHAKVGKTAGHFTPFEILDNVIKAKEKNVQLVDELPAKDSREPEVRKDKANVTNWWKLWVEYMKAVFRRHARFSWSHTGLKTMGINFIDSLTEEEYKKKFTKGGEREKLQTVAYLPSELFEKFCRIENFANVEHAILKLACVDDFWGICKIFIELKLEPPLRQSPFQYFYIEAAAA